MEKDNRPNILIIVIVVFLSLTIISLFINILLNKDNVKKVLLNQNLSSLLIKDKELNNNLDDKKVPKESITYIDEEMIHDYLINGIDRLYEGNAILISEDEVDELLRKSIKKYEEKKNVEIYDHIEKELKTTSKIISKRVSDSDSINTFNVVLNSSKVFIVFLSISIILLIYLLIKYKIQAFLYDGLILLGVPVLSYFIITRLSSNIIKQISFIDIENKYLINIIKQISLSICSIFFAIGLLLLIIYLIKYAKKLLVDFRLKYIYKY